jgi:hypothetical protein
MSLAYHRPLVPMRYEAVSAWAAVRWSHRSRSGQRTGVAQRPPVLQRNRGQVGDNLLDNPPDFVDLAVVFLLPRRQLPARRLLGRCQHAVTHVPFVADPVRQRPCSRQNNARPRPSNGVRDLHGVAAVAADGPTAVRSERRPGGYRVWNSKARRWWGDLYEVRPDELPDELNGARRLHKDHGAAPEAPCPETVGARCRHPRASSAPDPHRCC